MAIDDVSLIRIVGRYQQQNVVNTLHYQHTAQVSEDRDILNDFLIAWGDANETAWLACHIDSYELIGYKAFRVTGTAKIPAYINVGSNGTVAGEEVPSNVCRTITLYTGSTNHRRRGRVMMSGSATGMFNTTDGAVTTVHTAILQDLGDLLDTTLVTGADEFDLCLPASNGLPVEHVVASIGRVTPSSVKSRRVSQYLIG
jgi:hypothetical protein